MVSECIAIDVDDTKPLLIFGGPYSNLHALKAIRQLADDKNIINSQIICTGDVVAYCAHPEETVELIRDWGVHVVMGNCEEQLAAREDNCACGFRDGSTCATLSAGWYQYANTHISENSREWMGSLPRTIKFRYADKDFCVVHGSFGKVNQFIFPSTPISEKQRVLVSAKVDVIVGGHSGIPFIERVDDGVWFNPGVIGMPANDGTTDCWYGIIEPLGSELRFSIHRLPYDFASESEVLSRKGFAAPYAKALQSGLWPSLDILPEYEQGQTGVHIEKMEVVF